MSTSFLGHKQPGNETKHGHTPTYPPVLHLQEVADKAVRGAALHKVPLGREKPLRGARAKLLDKVVPQTRLPLLLDLVEGDGVAHRLHQTTLTGEDDHRVPAQEREKRTAIGMRK